MEKVKTKKVGNTVFVKYSEKIEKDIKILTPDFVQRLISLGKKVVLDMERVKKFYSAPIGNLAAISKTVESIEGKLYLVNVPNVVTQALNVVKIADKFTIYKTDLDFALEHGLEEKFVSAEWVTIG